MNAASVMKNFLWRLFERAGAQGVKLLVEIILARILLPEEYGSIAILTVFITVLNVFVDSGLGNSLIQKKEVDDLDYSSVFWFNVVWCILLYIALYLAAPLIAGYYQNEILCPVLRVLGLQIIISGVKNVFQAYVSRNMLFRKFFFATLGGTVGAAVVGIWMARSGMGIWALVGQHLFNVLMDTVILFFMVSWKPKRMFSLQRLKGLLSYGWKLLFSALLDTVYNEISQLVIGKVYTSADLAYYNRGLQFPSVITANINSSIDSVLLPTMSREQDARSRVMAMTKRAIKTSTFFMAPLMIGLAFVAEPLTRLLLTEKWLPAVPFLRIFCAAYLFFPIHTANLNAIKAIGRSDVFLKLEILKKIVGVATIVITMNISVEAMAYGVLVNSVICQVINAWPNRKLLGYSYGKQLLDILPNIGTALAMGLAVYPLKYLPLPMWTVLGLQILAGAGAYWGLAKITRNESYGYVLGVVKKIMGKNS